MSFGFSIGDFLAVGKIIHDVIEALHASESGYQELVRELEKQVNSLEHVDKLNGPPSQALAIDQIKCSALTCRYPLEDFLNKIRKFEKSLGLRQSNNKLKDAGRKAQWAFGLGKRDEVNRLRSYLAIHIDIINMQLIQQGLERLELASMERHTDHEALKCCMEESARELKDVRGDVEAQSFAIRQAVSMIQNLLGIVSGKIISPLEALTGAVSKVYISSQQIYDIVLEIRTYTRSIDTRFTYFQAPVKVKDVLGRVFPFPSELSFEALNAEIMARFKQGPGKSQVATGNYNFILDTKHPLSVADDRILLPGMSLFMTIVVLSSSSIFETLMGRNTVTDVECPMPFCRSNESVDALERRTCLKLGVWFEEVEEVAEHIQPLADLRGDPWRRASVSAATDDGNDADITNGVKMLDQTRKRYEEEEQLAVFKRITLRLRR